MNTIDDTTETAAAGTGVAADADAATAATAAVAGTDAVTAVVPGEVSADAAFDGSSASQGRDTSGAKRGKVLTRARDAVQRAVASFTRKATRSVPGIAALVCGGFIVIALAHIAVIALSILIVLAVLGSAAGAVARRRTQ